MAKTADFKDSTAVSALKSISVNIFYCHNCNIPLIQALGENGNFCPLCNSKVRYLASDLRPVFPEERLLFELIKNSPFEFLQDSVWCANSRYYVNGKAIELSAKEFENANAEAIAMELKKYSEKNEKNSFDFYARKFCEANKVRLKELTDEAFSFVHDVAKKTDEEHLVVSFSGGKDSTVTADIVTRALSNPSIVHIFGDTTLEFKTTLNYVARYRNSHPYAIFMTAKNEDQDFMEVADDIGPPARMMRWCCSMFKTGPISRILSNLFGDDAITTFYGIRKVESVSRSKYSRVTSGGEDVKIQRQTVASPIFYWKDIDIWLYMLSNNIDFNDAYRLGYDRVGCWCCPNNNTRAQFLSKIYMKKKADKWRNFLIDFAKRIGKQDAETYVDTGMWKARQGGNGLEAADDVKIKFTNCTTESNAKIYKLNRPFDESLLNLFTPFGRVAPELGHKLIRETPVFDLKSNMQIISIQPFFKDGFTHAVKIKTMNVVKKAHKTLHRQIAYQIRKFNSCRQCLKCESLCKYGAITISAGEYHIDEKKCVRCKKCVSQKYLAGGCMMEKYLRTKSGDSK